MILQDGQKIDRWQVAYLIKANAYCETYRVDDEGGNPYFMKLFLLKAMPEKLITRGEVNEIAYCRQLKHKNLLSYVADGVYAAPQGECRYVVATYFSGELLSERLQRSDGPLPVEQAKQIFADILHGVAYLHEQPGVLLHNDINPTNVMLSDKTGGVAELIDMGHVSHCVSGNPPFDTADLDPRYCSSQTFLGIYDETSDLFAATAVFYTMLTGRQPWDLTLPAGTTRKEQVAMVKAARQHEVDTSDIADEALRNIVQKGMALSTPDRYRCASDLLNDLQHPDEVEPFETAASRVKRARREAEQAMSEAATHETAVTVPVQRGSGHGFDDIAGMQALKDLLRQRVIMVLQDKELAQRYKLTPPNGMLLYGPPGCGKSFFAEKFAEETGFNFMLVKASDVGSIYLHGTQGKIADLFKQAEEHAPTVLCFDEFDAFVPTRSSDVGNHQSGEVNEFLSQLNNCSQRGIFVIATSNRPDKIDPAVLRTGRIDKQVYVPLPDEQAREELFALYLQGRPCGDIDCKQLAAKAEGYVASDIAYVVNEAAMIAALNHADITQALLETTIAGIRPSVKPALLKQYEQLREQMEGINHSNALPRVGFRTT